jgi:tetratricopeptide (TPR) repeat protein
MNALLSALGPRRKRTWTAVAGIVGVAAIVAALLIGSRSGDAPEACPLARDKLAGVWDQSRRAEVRQAFSTTNVPYADEAFRTVSSTLDRYASDWLNMRRDACLATVERREQSAHMLDLRMICLGRRLDELGALTAELVKADKRVVEKAVQAVDALPSLSRCADARALTERVPPPDDAATRSQIAGERKRIARASALNAAGKFRPARKLIESVVASAKKIGYAPLIAEAMSLEGLVALRMGDGKVAAASLLDGYLAALAGRDNDRAMRVASRLVFAVGYRLGRHEEGNTWARTAKALLDAGEPNPALESDVENHLALIQALQGKYDQATRHARRAIALRKKAYGERHRITGIAYHTLAVILKKRGQYRDALESYRTALQIFRTSLGDAHPFVAMVRHNIGVVLKRLGNNVAARKMLRSALASWERSLPRNHPNIGMALLNLGTVETNLGHLSEAKTHLARARAIKAKRFGATHWKLALVDLALGDVFQLQGDSRKALELYEPAAERLEKGLGPNHPDVASAFGLVGTARFSLGDLAGAEKALRRALEVRQRAKSTNLIDLASTRFLLAQVIGRDRARRKEAKHLAQQALTAYRRTGKHAAEAKKIERWLARKS